MLNERSQTQKTIYYMIPLRPNFQKWQNNRHTESVVDRGRGVRAGTGQVDKREKFLEDESVLKLDCDSCCTI